MPAFLLGLMTPADRFLVILRLLDIKGNVSNHLLNTIENIVSVLSPDVLDPSKLTVRCVFGLDSSSNHSETFFPPEENLL